MDSISVGYRRWWPCRCLASAAFYAWAVLAFPSHSTWTTSTCTARGFPQIATSRTTGTKTTIAQRCGQRAFRLQLGGETIESTAHSTSTTTGAPAVPSYEGVISKFLTSRGKAVSSSSLLKQFEIQGWRWHTKSLVRDARRLHNLALRTDLETAEILKDASDHVVGFNLMGLHKIEASLFFPWMREKLTTNTGKPELAQAFSSAMTVLESDRRVVARLGETISQNALAACDTRLPESRRSIAISEVAKQSAELQQITHKMMSLEDSFLAPAIGAMVPTREQKSFNNRVLRKLGILDSRLHLVGMYEAVWEDQDSDEKELFEQAIPSLSRQMIPRWKRKLYQPKTYMLE